MRVFSNLAGTPFWPPELFPSCGVVLESRSRCVRFSTIRPLPRWVVFLPIIERAEEIAPSCQVTFFEKRRYFEIFSIPHSLPLWPVDFDAVQSGHADALRLTSFMFSFFFHDIRLACPVTVRPALTGRSASFHTTRLQ